MLDGIREIFHYRELIGNLVKRDLKVRYKRSVLGFFWSFLNPLLLMIVYSVCFSYIIRIQVENIPYFIFLLGGLLPWIFFETSLLNSTDSIVQNFDLIQKVNFPREVIPISIVLSNLVNFLLSLLPLLIILLLWKIEFSWLMLLLPVLVAIQITLTLGFSLFLACLNVFFRDVGVMLNVIVRAWFFLTPIIYDLSKVPQKIRPILMANPMTPITIAYKDLLLRARLPNLGYVSVSVLFSILILLIGHLMFRRYEHLFIKLI